MSFIISTDDLTKKYKQLTALGGVSVHVEQGTVYGLIGRAGAGKSTLLKILAGLSLPTEGSVLYGKVDGRRPRIGVLVEDPGLYGHLSAKQNMEIKRLAFGGKNDREAEEILERLGLTQWSGVKARSFSSDMRQRLGVAMAMVGDPDILLLDEPFTGLDQKSIQELRSILGRMAKEENKTIVITGTGTAELSGLASVFGMLDNGRLTGESSEEEIMSRMPGYLKLVVDPVDAAREVLNSMGIFGYQTKTFHMIHVLEQIDRREEILEKMALAGVQVSECTVIREFMDNVYSGFSKEGPYHA